MVLRCITLLLLTWLAGCAQKPVSFDFDAKAQMPAMKTYTLQAPAAAGGQYQSLDNNRIEAALRKTLAGRNLQETTADAADIVVAYRVVQERKVDDSGVRFGFGLGTGNVGLGVSTGPKPKEVSEGKLVVDVVDPTRQQVVWSARANRNLTDAMKPDQREALISSLVSSMFADFPPQSR